MWQYFWLHQVFHFARLCPKHRTRKCPLVLLLLVLSVCTLVPHLYVIVLPEFYLRYCLYPVHSLLVAQIVLSLIMLGFCVLFLMMEPVIPYVKWAFHIFGLVDFVFGIGFVTFCFLPDSCILTAEPVSVYVIYLITAIGTIISIGYFLVLIPLWIWNAFISKGSLVDPATKDKPEKDTTLCNSLIKKAPCLWHI